MLALKNSSAVSGAVYRYAYSLLAVAHTESSAELNAVLKTVIGNVALKRLDNLP